jgi:hypothetical protein
MTQPLRNSSCSGPPFDANNLEMIVLSIRTRFARLLQDHWSRRLASLALCCVHVTAGAQEQREERGAVGASQLLQQFEREGTTHQNSLLAIVRYPDRHGRAKVDSVLDGLERLALTSTSDLVRARAAGNLAMAGASERPVPGILQRAMRVYQASNDPQVRRAILRSMGFQKDRTGSINVLKAVVIQARGEEDFPEAPFLAASALHWMGKEAAAALVELRDEGAIKDPVARGVVDYYYPRR